MVRCVLYIGLIMKLASYPLIYKYSTLKSLEVVLLE
jgi:hypothetical protein